jgi:hypothetical protein
MVPKTAPSRGINRRNEFAGKMYAVVEVWAVVRATKEILDGYPAPREVLDFWIDQWPKCLPIRRWYDLRIPKFFSEIHPDALKESRIARGKLRTPVWLTEAAALGSKDLVEREVFVTPALKTIVAMSTCETSRPLNAYVSYSEDLARLMKQLCPLDLTDLRLQLASAAALSVIWNYCDMFGPERLAKLLLIDQMPMITSNPAWSEEERINSGAIFDPQSLYETINALAGPDGVETTRGFIGGMVTKAIPEEEKAWIIEGNLTMPRRHAATLLYNHSTQDWRDLIPRIQLPTLVVGGRVSTVPWRSQVWIAEQIPGSRLEIFEEEEGGNHFMFIEGHEKFNQIVADFVG